MTPDDDKRISEEEMDEIVSRVVDQLGGAGPEETDIAVHVEDDEDQRHGDGDGDDDDSGETNAADTAADGRERAERRREEASERKREAKRRAREASGSGMDDLGERIEAVVEAQLDSVADTIERSLGPAGVDAPEPPAAGVTIGPGDTREKAVYKTQLQKGGRVAVPDAEIDALGLEPGDTLQVVLYPV